jgi:arylformamidase
MTELVYRQYSQSALDEQYNARGAVSAFDAFVQRWRETSERAVRDLPCTLDMPYGENPVETLDIFHPLGGGPAPVLMFFHGGYWRAGDKSWFRFLAKPFTERGAMVVMPRYGLCPTFMLDALVDQCRRAVAWTFRNAGDHGGDSARLFISGHSAGAHIAGMMLATNWANTDGLPANVIKGLTGISGLYDLEPIRLSKANGPLQLTVESARRNSPVMLPPPAEPPSAILAFGNLESHEYGRQTAAYADVLRDAGGTPISVGVAGHHHFSILDAFGNPRHHFGQAVLKQLGLA